MNEEFQRQQEQDEEASMVNMELHYLAYSAVIAAKELGLEKGHLETLCHFTGIDYSLIGD